MKVKLMVDSATDINQTEAKKLGITMMPMQVRFKNEEFLDGVNLTPSEFYQKLIKDKELPKTSLVNQYQWEEVFKKSTEDGSELVVITISSKLSGTYQNAVEAAKQFEGKVFVIDSLNACIGERLLSQYALMLIKQGKSGSEIAKELEEKKSKIKLMAVIDTLKFLKKGGRISATTAFVGEVLGIKPVIGVIDGEVKVIGKAKGLKKGGELLNSLVKECGGINFEMPYGLIYSGTSDSNLQKYKEDGAYLWQNSNAEIPTYQIGCTIGTHVGPGAIGIAFFEK